MSYNNQFKFEIWSYFRQSEHILMLKDTMSSAQHVNDWRFMLPCNQASIDFPLSVSAATSYEWTVTKKYIALFWNVAP